MRKNSLKLLSLGLLLSVSLSVAGCGKDETAVESTENIVVESTEAEIEESTDSTMETGVSEVETVSGGIEVSESEAQDIDLIIEQLSEDVMRENVDPSHIDGLIEPESTVNPEEEAKRQEAEEWEESVRESLGVDESTDETESETTTEDSYDYDGNPNTRELPGYEEAKNQEAVIGDDGAIVDTPEVKIERAKKEGSGAQIGSNTSEKMKVGSVYDYFVDDGSKVGRVGNFVMCGKLGVTVTPALSELGYTVTSSGDTVTISNSGVGSVSIRKLNTDSLNPSKMSKSQIESLSGLSNTTEYMNGTSGSYEQYSACIVDFSGKNAVQYYKCGFGTYEFKYNTPFTQYVYTMILTVYPESSLNAVVGAE